MVTKCEKGHWYDSKLYQECPHCKMLAEQSTAGVGSLLAGNEMVSVASMEQQPVSVSYDEAGAGNDDDHTISFGEVETMQIQPVTGWLVCMTGANRGRDFRLHSGKNFIGKSVLMDISIPDDEGIAQENHCAIVYDHKHNAFILINSGVSAVICNGEEIEKSKILKSGDKIKLGETVLVFIPFCQGERKWTDID